MKARLRSLLPMGASLPSREDPTMNPTAGEFEVDTWAISAFVVHSLVPVVGTHPFPLHELMLMTAAVCRLHPAQIFEWGTHIGKSARVFYEVVNHFGLDAEIHSTDLPDDVVHVEHPHGDRGKLVQGLTGVQLHQGDGVETSLRLWQSGGRKPRPLFFVDGDHSRDSVLRELAAIAAAVPDAAMLVHDTFYQSPDSDYNIGPHAAIRDLVATTPGRFHEYHSGLGLPGMTLLYAIT